MWEDIAFLKQSKTAIKILQKLDVPRTPTEIARALNVHQQSVSSTIKKLEARKLVTCLNPGNQNYRHYQSTEKGKNLLKNLCLIPN